MVSMAGLIGLLILLIVLVIFYPQIENAFNNISLNLPNIPSPDPTQTTPNQIEQRTSSTGCVFKFVSETNEGGTIDTYSCPQLTVYEEVKNPQGIIVEKRTLSCSILAQNDFLLTKLYQQEGVCPLFD